MVTPVSMQQLIDAGVDCGTISSIATSLAESVVDRLGQTKLTMVGACSKIGFEQPLTYVTSGQTLYRPNQTVTNSGSVYAPALGTLFPFTTSGVFNTLLWRVVSQIDTNTVIDEMLNTVQVLNIQSLRLTAPKNTTQTIHLREHTSSRIGGGDFAWDNSSVLDDDNGIVIKVASITTGRWIRDVGGRNIDGTWFGALPGASDSSAAFQAASNYVSKIGGFIQAPTGEFNLGTTGFTINQIVGDEGAMQRIGLCGAGSGATRFNYSGVGNAIKVYSQYAGVVVDWFSMYGFRVQQSSTVKNGTGLFFNYCAYFSLTDVYAFGFNRGFDGVDVLGVTLNKCIFRENNYGMVAQGNTLTPNAITLFDCNLSSNTSLAAYITGGVLFNMYGGDVEGNGWTPQDVNRSGGVVIESGTSGLGGAVSANFHGTYFEGNGSVADVMLFGGDSDSSSTLNFEGCTFNRISNETGRFCTNNISVALGLNSTSKTYVTYSGCGFKGFPPYVTSSSRKYVSISSQGARYNVNEGGGNIYSDATERPSFIGPVISDRTSVSSACVFNGINASIINNMLNVQSVTKNGVGDYTVLFEKPMSTPWYIPSVEFTTAGAVTITSPTINSLRFSTVGLSNIAYDPPVIYFSTIGGGDILQ